MVPMDVDVYNSPIHPSQHLFADPTISQPNHTASSSAPPIYNHVRGEGGAADDYASSDQPYTNTGAEKQGRAPISGKDRARNYRKRQNDKFGDVRLLIPGSTGMYKPDLLEAVTARWSKHPTIIRSRLIICRPSEVNDELSSMRKERDELQASKDNAIARAEKLQVENNALMWELKERVDQVCLLLDN